MGTASMQSEFGALILAGGMSERMQYPKAFLLLDGGSMAERIVDRYHEAGIRDIYIVVNHHLYKKEWRSFLEPLNKKATLIPNHDPERGRSHSLLLGMNNLMDRRYCFIQNVDNPPAETALIRRMMSRTLPDGITVPVFKGKGGHPVLISNKLMREILRHPAEELHLRDLLNSCPRQEVIAEDEGILQNLNTREEYFQYLNKIRA